MDDHDRNTLRRRATLPGAARHKNQTVNDGVAHSKNPRKCAYHVTFDLDLEHTWMHANLESILWKFGGDPAICVRED